MGGRADTGYKQAQRFPHRADLHPFLRRLFQEGNRVCPGRSYRGGTIQSPKDQTCGRRGAFGFCSWCIRGGLFPYGFVDRPKRLSKETPVLRVHPDTDPPSFAHSS